MPQGDNRATLVNVAMILALAACGPSYASAANPLVGVYLSELSKPANSQPVAVLLMHPSECLTCGSGLPEWMDLAKQLGTDRMPILLRDQPDDNDRKVLILAHVRVRGVVLDEARRGGRRTTVIVMANGRVLEEFDLTNTRGLGAVLPNIKRLLGT